MPYVRERMNNFIHNDEIDQMLQTGIFFKSQPTFKRITSRAINNEAGE